MTDPLAPDALARRVAEVVAGIPPGRVLTYGDVAELAECRSARLIGSVMARNPTGRDLPWWRVVTVRGTLADHLQAAAREHYRDEGTPVRADDRHLVRVDMDRALWSPETPADRGSGSPQGARAAGTLSTPGARRPRGSSPRGRRSGP
ncbi:MGMT family protein [Kocuria sp. M1R5S2]|uniref:MGMT family protein n=1 Tax=Kocuria rhizosphaerae TaxID=3376285 RepID=UPI0037AB19B5